MMTSTESYEIYHVMYKDIFLERTLGNYRCKANRGEAILHDIVVGIYLA